jgi:hypothetical protein
MPRTESQTAELRRFIIRRVRQHPGDIAAVAMAEFQFSREWVNRVLQQLIREGLLAKTGRTKGVQYALAETTHRRTFRLTPESEHALWNRFVEPLLQAVPANVKDICFYGFSEMVNNVIDHAGVDTVALEVTLSAERIDLMVSDRGIGIFVKIKRALGLDSTRHAVFTLSKGKFTTDASRHTGEGVFFTSRAFDSFAILSSGLFFEHSRDSDAWLVEDRNDEHRPGTSVFMSIDPTSGCRLEDVFRGHNTRPDEVGFNKTTLVLSLAQYADGPLLSRSQAKRVLAGVYRFAEAVMDFTGVDTIGPAFADEIFRVYRRAHPEIEIVPIKMNEACTRMVRRAEDAAAEQVRGDGA